jgi:hypothetical protein
MRWLGCLALLLITTAGCVQFPLAVPKKGTPLAAEAPVTRTPPPVTAEQVNELNARSKMHALQEELDRAASVDVKTGPEQPPLSR